MSALNKGLISLILLYSSILRSQTFVQNAPEYIGKTEKEINIINAANNFKISEKKKHRRVSSIVYCDSLNSMMHYFFFVRKAPLGLGRPKCLSYLVNISDKSGFEKIKADLQTKCEEKISDRDLVQIVGGKKYVWHFFSCSNEPIHYTLAVEKQ